jgi:hypothetical protein
MGSVTRKFLKSMDLRFYKTLNSGEIPIILRGHENGGAAGFL